jgi:hypothetical protein
MTALRRDLADYCEYLPEGSHRPCYALASLVLVRPTGETLRFTCAEHAPAWASRIQGRYLVLERQRQLQLVTEHPKVLADEAQRLVGDAALIGVLAGLSENGGDQDGRRLAAQGSPEQDGRKRTAGDWGGIV